MHRVRPLAAVVPALLPGACVLLLAFQAGGFFPASWAALAARRGGRAGAAGRARRAPVRRLQRVERGRGRRARAVRDLDPALAAAGRTRPGARSWSSAGCSPTCSSSSSAPRWRRARAGWRGRCAAGARDRDHLRGRADHPPAPGHLLQPGQRLRAPGLPDHLLERARDAGRRRRHPRAAPVGLRARAVAGPRARRRAARRSPSAPSTSRSRAAGSSPSTFGVAVYLVLGFSRATPGALLAIVPDDRLRVHPRLRRRPARRQRQLRLRGRARAGPRRRDRAPAERAARRSRSAPSRCCSTAGCAALPGRAGCRSPRAWRPPPPS